MSATESHTHEAHSRRPWECRTCGARTTDGRSWAVTTQDGKR